jgi:hypothetical protein
MPPVADAAQSGLIAMDDDISYRADFGRARLTKQVERLCEAAPPQGVDGRMDIDAGPEACDHPDRQPSSFASRDHDPFLG